MIVQGDGTFSKLLSEGRCPRCHSEMRVEVHGHVQCGVCKMYVDECCSGETASCTTSVSVEEEEGKDGDSPETENQRYAEYDNL